MTEVCRDEKCLTGEGICEKHKQDLICEWHRLMPLRYKTADLNDFGSQVIKDVEEYIDTDKSQGLYVFGDIGCGKTRLKWAIIKHMIDTIPIKSQKQTVPFNEFDCKNLTYTFHWYYTGRGESSVVSYIKSFIRHGKVLILDDFGHGETTKDTFAVNMWNILLDEVYNSCQRIIIVSNYSLDGISSRVGSYATDRIGEMCKGSFIELTGKSKR